ncbi:MAG TPA: septum formation initiator family protein [Ktedonobacteraceae bacterium]|nr:septum formation initiator family protein [Ktedonobacteraceae bacterium]
MQQNRSRRPQFASRPEGSNPNVTSAIGMEETFGRLRARRSSLFTRTVIWLTGLVCLAFLLATFAQAWSNSQLVARVQTAQQQYQQVQNQNTQLNALANHYKAPSVVEREAREQLGYIRPGEHPVIIISSTTPAPATIPRKAPPPAPRNFWQSWWNVFFGG